MAIIPFSDSYDKRQKSSEKEQYSDDSLDRIFVENGVAVICIGGMSAKIPIPDFAIPRNSGETVRYIVRTPVVRCANGIIRYPVHVTWLAPRIIRLPKCIPEKFQKPRIIQPDRFSGITPVVDVWVRTFERTFKNPWHVAIRPNKRMGRDVLWKIAQQLVRFVASDNEGKAPGIVAFQRKTRYGDLLHAHLLVDAEKLSLHGWAQRDDVFWRRIVDTKDGADGGLRYIAKMLAADPDVEKLPDTWLDWPEPY
jgi:hypothetical protein